MIEIVIKNVGTKCLSLGADGTLCSDGSAAQRVHLPDLHSFGRLLDPTISGASLILPDGSVTYQMRRGGAA